VGGDGGLLHSEPTVVDEGRKKERAGGRKARLNGDLLAG